MAELRDQLQETLGDSYVLEQELGGGGMSRVFVAHEAALGRKVVVKVLPAEMAAAVSLDRFRREIQLAAQLQHPHIVPLLTAGETSGLPFFTMPYVRGESLRAKLSKGGELPISETVRFLREVASALAYAHENNIVHRDIKPENVLVSGGSAVVTDFGVAKALSASSGASGMSLTSMGVALGTPAYMAPEQATADPNTDHRADIYALGVMAYEMLTGSTPFQGRSPQATLAAHVTETPDQIINRRASVPPLLAALVMSCLEKRPADRPQTAHEIMHQLDALSTPSGGLPPTLRGSSSSKSLDISKLRWIAIGTAAVAVIAVAGFFVSKSSPGPSAEAEVPVIAVLPFENVGKVDGTEFTDGITEEITSRLSSLRGLRVIGRQTSKGYAGTNKTPQQIATELGVTHLLTGTVRWDRSVDGKEMVRVSPALVRTSDATQVWGQPYQTVLSGIFEVQSKLATEVASALNVALLQPERDALEAKPTENVEAYTFFLRGNELVTTSIEVPDLREAVVALEKAVKLDPKFALAFARLSLAHTELYWFYGDRTAERARKARAAADKALELDPSLAAGHLALGIYYYHAAGLDYDNALRELSIAEAARPNDFEVLFFKAAIQRRQGKWKEAIADMNKALAIEPRIGNLISDLANAHLFQREYDEAERLADRALIVVPGERDALAHKADIAIARDGDVNRAVRFYRERFDAQRSSPAGLNYVQGWPATLDPEIKQTMKDLKWSPNFGEKSLFYSGKMQHHYYEGAMPAARAYADSTVVSLRASIRDRPDDPIYQVTMARAQAILGNRAEVMSALRRADAILPISKDAFGGADVIIDKAVTLTILGDQDAAITELERALSIPSAMSKNRMRLSPAFAPLRGNPRFQALLSAGR